MNVYEVIFDEYPGDSKWLLAASFNEATAVASAWGKKYKYGVIQSLNLEGSIDITRENI